MQSMTGLVGLLALIIVGIVNILFAIAIIKDAERLILRGECLFLVGPGLWSLATLLGGIPAVALYWAVHYSALRPKT